MIITCDSFVNMGYIYLQPPTQSRVEEYEKMGNKLLKYVDPQKIIIHQKVDNSVEELLNQMKQSKKTYSEALDEEEIDPEFCNDFDNDSHVKGIEFVFTKEKLISLVNSNSFNSYFIKLNGTDFRLYTLDTEAEAFNSNNVIYPLTKEMDSYLIVKVEKRSSNVGIIKGLMTSREDKYPTDYMLKPLFILHEYSL
jgi:uncharacterized protein YuzE